MLGPGRFDVIDRPCPDSQYDPQAGYRINRHTGQAVCVHPYRVGLPPGAYASANTPLPAPDAPLPAPTPIALELPVELVDLEGWLVAVLRTTDPDRMASPWSGRRPPQPPGSRRPRSCGRYAGCWASS